MTEQEKADLSKIILQVIQQLQPDAKGWVDLANIGASLSNAGVDYKQYHFRRLGLFLRQFSDVLEFTYKSLAGVKWPVPYARPKSNDNDSDAEPSISVSSVGLPSANNQCTKSPQTHLSTEGDVKMTEQEKADLSKKILQVIQQLQPDAEGWVDLANIGSSLSYVGVDYKQYQFPKLGLFLHEFSEILEFTSKSSAEGKPPVAYARAKAHDHDSDAEPSISVSSDNLPSANSQCTDSQQTHLSTEEDVKLTEQEKADLSKKILQVIQQMQPDAEGWVDLANIGSSLSYVGVDYKQYQFPKLGLFLHEFSEILEFTSKSSAEGKPPVAYARAKAHDHDSDAEPSIPVPSVSLPSANNGGERIPSKDSWLFQWASIPNAKIDELSKLALKERWYYGKTGETLTVEQQKLPILRNYLAYTFKRLCFEGKILIKADPERNNEEFAAFNTGLVDKKYEYIYALFKQNTQYPNYYWYLMDFVVAGEDNGKILIKLFNPLPKCADYFEGKIQNMLYDPSTGGLFCDYMHIITERTDRFPTDFLKENCSLDFLCIDGVSIDDVCHKPARDENRKAYYASLGRKIKDDQNTLNRLKNRIEAAINLAIKRVGWNYKTAIPMYFPTRNTGSLLLPLSLVDEDRVDLALVVERLASGAYQGQTILSLDMAYSNSRLVTRPDSDWLKTDIISAADSNGDDEDDD